MLELIEKHPVKVILIICIGIFFTNLDVLYVNIMEARNFVTAREMIHNGNWVLTTMNDYPRYEKPPLPTWLTAISAMAFGVHNLFALRLPAALSALTLVFFFYKIALLISNNKKLSFYAALILPTSFYIIFSGRNGQWDIFTHSFMIISIFFLIRMLQNNHSMWKNAVLSGLFFGCSFLSKGPVSLYALWLPFIIAYAIVYRKNLKKLHLFPFVIMLLLGLSVGISWFAYVRYADPQSFLEIAKEEANNWTSYNIRPFYYYWSFFTQSGIWTVPAFIALLYPYLKNKVSDKKAYRFSFLWTISAVILLSIIPEKKSRYLLPVLIPMAFNTTFYIEYLVLHFASLRKGEKLPVYVNFGLIACIGIAFPFGGYILLKDTLNGFFLSFVVTALVLFTIGVFIFYFLRKQQIKNVFFLTIAFTVTILAIGFPLAKTFNRNSNYNNIDGLKTDLQLYSYKEPAPEMIWHLGKAAPNIVYGGKPQFPTEKEFGILVNPNNEDDFKRIFEKKYVLEYQEIFDVNYTASPKERAYKNRLVSQYFIVKKKSLNHDNQ